MCGPFVWSGSALFSCRGVGSLCLKGSIGADMVFMKEAFDRIVRIDLGLAFSFAATYSQWVVKNRLYKQVSCNHLV